jgi:hemolysin III
VSLGTFSFTIIQMSTAKQLKKPHLRGYFHQEFFFISLGACILLIAKSTSQISLIASLIYSLGVLFLFGVSAVYHRPHWNPKPRALLKRLDHSAIFILIASTVTPICMFALSEKSGNQFLIVIWTSALIGICQSIFWVTAPKILTSLFYVAIGWLTLPYVSELRQSLGSTKVNLIVIGGAVYTAGALFYALKRPKLFPTIFGYHELFHVFTIVGASLHFIVIYQLIS